MSDPRPDFTIIMPTRNHARWIEESVRSVLEQDVAGRVELIVFDALSDDDTPAILERYRDRITWIRGADKGQVDAINRGLSEAKGELVAWLNSDDLYLPHALAAVRAAFAADPALDFVYGDVLEINEDGRIMTPNPFTEDCVAERYLLSHNFMCQPTVFVRRRVFGRAGPLRDDLRWFMDYEWFARFYKAGMKGARLRQFLAANRDHPATKTNSGGFARWWEAMSVFSANPGPFLLRRRSIWLYSLEYVIKSLNAAGWAAPVDLPIEKRNPQQRTVDWLNARLVKLMQPRSFDEIIQRYGAEIAPQGGNVADLWARAAACSPLANPPCAPAQGHVDPGIRSPLREERDSAPDFPALTRRATPEPTDPGSRSPLREQRDQPSQEHTARAEPSSGSAPFPSSMPSASSCSNQSSPFNPPCAHAQGYVRTPPEPSMPAIVPLEPELTRAYPNLVDQMHDALRQLMFPNLPEVPGRKELMHKLLGTGIPEAMYVLSALHEALRDPGAVCELGVAQGATSALLANELRATDRKLWLYDSFAGLPKPSAKDQLKDDIFNLGSIERYAGEMRCPIEEVQLRLDRIGIDSSRYQICAGWIQETLREGAGPVQVCFAYVDFDFYEPIAYALDYLHRHLTPHGRIVVDDYDFFSTGAKTAVDEFVQKHPEYELVLPEKFAGAFCLLRRRSA